MREIVLDTETTGLSPNDGHRLVEIGCVELMGHIPTGQYLQIYLNPERPVPAEATAVHGLTDSFLADKPIFAQAYTQLLDLIGQDARLIIHNATFDMGFLNYELRNVGHEGIPITRVVDTLDIAHKRFPGSPANLDALCRRFEIDASARTQHGALLDAQLLADVYLELLGGRQHGLDLDRVQTITTTVQTMVGEVRPPRFYAASAQEMAAHVDMLKKFKILPLWQKA